jgi:hypothetical protein
MREELGSERIRAILHLGDTSRSSKPDEEGPVDYQVSVVDPK